MHLKNSKFKNIFAIMLPICVRPVSHQAVIRQSLESSGGHQAVTGRYIVSQLSRSYKIVTFKSCLIKDLRKTNLNLVFVTSLLTKQKNGKARNKASQKTILKNSTLVHAVGILANQAKPTKYSIPACETNTELILNC